MGNSIHGHMPPAADVESVLADPAGACPDCVRIVVKRLCHDLDVQRAAMATMLADERQMAAAHDRMRAERDDYRARLVATDRAYAEQAARADAAEAERDAATDAKRRTERELDQMAKRVDQGRAAAVAYVERITEVEAERDRLAEQVERGQDADLVRRAIADPGAYVKRKLLGDGEPAETVPAWGARAVIAALNGTEASS